MAQSDTAPVSGTPQPREGTAATVLTAPSYRAPEIPGKYEIIPIHTSDRDAFKTCRRRWNWTSPARQNLTVRADIHGVNPNFWFGTGIHWALEQFYTPSTQLRRDPVEAWKTWFNVQWRGGTVTEEWLDRVYDLKPRLLGADLGEPLYIVRGLEDIIPDPDHDLFDELLELGIQMMTFYKGYAELNDEFEMLVNEHVFSIPVWDYENDCILMAVDTREQSPNFGKKLEVHARGRMDGIWVKPNGRLGVIDHKTSATIKDDFFEKLETDEQVTAYLYAAEVEATYYNLPYAGEAMEECIYNVLRKNYPKPPTIVRGGLFSIDREKESCTHTMLMEWINAQDPDTLPPLTEKHENYISYLEEVGDEQFIIRKHVRRNRHQLSNAGYRLYQEAMDMLNPELQIYPNLSNDYGCLRCSFRAPCIAKEDGSDWESLIADNYTVNKDR